MKHKDGAEVVEYVFNEVSDVHALTITHNVYFHSCCLCFFLLFVRNQ